MNLHESDLKSRLVRFLGRKQMPRRFEGKPAPMEDEISALLAALTRNAPRSTERLADWWRLFEARLGEACGSMWPTEKEIRDIAQAVSRENPVAVASSSAWDSRAIAITSRKMKRGEPVGEGYLWGMMAVEMIAEGLIDRETMQRYREGAFWNRVGKDHPSAEARQEALAKARQWEAEAKDRHEAAKAVYRARHEAKDHHDTSLPDKSARPAVAAE